VVAAAVNDAQTPLTAGWFFPGSARTRERSIPKGENVMDQSELNEQSTSQPETVNAAQVIAPPINTNNSAVSPATCASCGAAADTNGNGLPTQYVFAIFERSKTLDQDRDIDLWVVRMDGKNPRLLMRNGFSPSWRYTKGT
jgi:hypothetical protein